MRGEPFCVKISPNEWGLQMILPVSILIHQHRNFEITEGKEFSQRHLIESTAAFTIC